MVQFDKVLNEFEDNISQVNAYINKASVYMYNGINNEEEVSFNIDKAINILLKNKDTLDKTYYQETLAKAYFNKAFFFSDKEKKENVAINLFKKVFEIDGIEHYKPTVYLELIKLEIEKKEKYLSDIYIIIEENNLNFEDNDILSFSEINLYEYLYYLIDSSEDELLGKVLNYCQNTFDKFKSKCSVLFSCSRVYYDDKYNVPTKTNHLIKHSYFR